MKGILGKYAFAFFISLIGYIIYASLILFPSIYKSYSLIDDGQTYINSEYFKDCITLKGCSNFFNKVVLEKEFNRFRPTYWVIQSTGELITNHNPELLHQIRVFVVGTLIVLLQLIILIKLNVHPILLPLSVALTTINLSFTENIVRLGPVEPYQVILLALYSLVLLSKLEQKQKMLLVILGALLVSLKETSLVLIISTFATLFLFGDKKDRKYSLLLCVSLVVLYGIGKYLSLNNNTYTESYILKPEIIIRNAKLYFSMLTNYFGSFATLSLLMIPLLLLKDIRKMIFNKPNVFWLITSVLLIGILLPWEYVLDRYILPVVFCTSILISIILNVLIVKSIDAANKFIRFKYSPVVFYSLVTIVVLNLYFRTFPINIAKSINYQRWYAQFLLFEKDQLEAIAGLKERTVVKVNAKDELGNWEVFYELPIHMKYIYKKRIIFERLSEINYKKGDIIFSRSMLTPSVEENTINKETSIIATKSYSVSQIDPMIFRNMFVNDTVGAIVNPPIGDTYTFFWTVGKVK